MGAAIFIGDELSASGFRLTGIETLVPKPDAVGAAFEEARIARFTRHHHRRPCAAYSGTAARSSDAGRGAYARDHSRRAVPRTPARSGKEAQERPGHRNMSQASLIPSLQSEALAREVEQQLKNETSAVIAAAATRRTRDNYASARRRAPTRA